MIHRFPLNQPGWLYTIDHLGVSYHNCFDYKQSTMTVEHTLGNNTHDAFKYLASQISIYVYSYGLPMSQRFPLK